MARYPCIRSIAYLFDEDAGVLVTLQETEAPESHDQNLALTVLCVPYA